MTHLATNPDAVGIVFVVVWTALCFGVMAALPALSVTSTRARGGSEC